MTTITRRGVASGLLAAGLVLVLAPTVALADDPERPIRIILPTQAGGAMDATARMFARWFEEKAGISMVVVNMEGAGGTVGTRAVMEADPDGYTIGMWWEGLVTSRVMGVVDYDHNDFAVIGSTGYTQVGLGVAEDGPIESLEDLIEQGRAAPGAIKVATNIGLPVHFYPLMFQEAIGADFRYVQSGGGARRMPSVVGGHTDVSIFDTLEFVNYGPSGIRPIVLFGEERSPIVPDVPTAREHGIDLVLRASRIWIARKDTTEEIVDFLRGKFEEAMQDPDMLETSAEPGIEPTFLHAEDLAANLDEIRDKSEPLVAKARQIQQ